MGVYQRKNSPYWWLQYFAFGERIQESSGSESKAEAVLMEKRRKQELANGTWRHPRNRGIKFAKLVDEFKESTAYLNRAKTTQSFYDQRIGQLLPFFENIQVMAMSRRDVEAYVKRQTTSKTTIHHDLTTLFTILKWAARESYIPHVPFATERLKPSRDDFRSQTLSVEDEKALLKAAQPYQRAQIIAALDAGMHKKEIFGQKWADVDLKAGLITMSASKKGRVGRVVPLTKRFADVLGQLPRESEYVFTFRGNRIQTDTKRGWYRILRDAKISDIRFHDLRATFGTRLEDELDIAPAVSMALMGHNLASSSAHGRYIRTRLPRMREAIKKLDQWIEANGLLHTYYTNREGKVLPFPASA